MKTIFFILGIGILFLFGGCNKFLEEKSDKKLAVPSKLQDLQALMDDISQGAQTAFESEVSTDDYYVKETDLVSQPESEQAMYKWARELPNDDLNGMGWLYGYKEVYYCNLVLEGINEINTELRNSIRAKDVMGQALIKRAAAMLAMAEIWTLGYDSKNLNSPYGLPIRKNTNFNEKSRRSTLGETYSFIEEDLMRAKDLLPVKSISKYRPTKAAAYGYLARLYLYKNDFINAAIFADSCIYFHGGKLLDFGTLDYTKRYGMPLPETNPEVVYIRGLASPFILGQTVAKISPVLLNTYKDNDYRKSLFFYTNSDGTMRFKGSYRGSASHFSGIALDEMYLIKMESCLRTDNLERAKTVADDFIKNRYNLSGSENKLSIDILSKEQLLNFTLMERRRELLMRSLRWSDIKRLNKIGYNIGLERYGANLALPANDLRFALPLPQSVIDVTEILQNQR